MTAMTDDHEEAVKLFKVQSKEGKDPALKSFAMKTLPTLEEHNDLARRDRKEVKKEE